MNQHGLTTRAKVFSEMPDTTHRTFLGVKLIEQPDGSVKLLVRTVNPDNSRRQDLEIHLAKHVAEDIGFLFYQRFSNPQRGISPRRMKARMTA